jgi:putative membrane protein
VGAPADPRFSLANERTFLAWNRTALALIGGGLAAAQLLQTRWTAVRILISMVLIVLGCAIGIAGVGRWRASELALRARAPLPRASLAPAIVGLGTTAIGVMLIVVLALGAVGR